MMQNYNTTLYYFSGTGNSLHIAKALKEKLSNCELLPIAGLINQDSITAISEKIGFVFPVYTWALPKIVYDFIEKIDLSNTEYIFAVTSMGGFSRQYVAPLINKLLEPKNKDLDFAYSLRVFSNNIWGSKRINPLPSKEKREKRIQKAVSKLENIAEIIRNNQKDTARKVSFYPMEKSYSSFIKDVNTMDEKYDVDEKCNGCGICQKICPVDNIKLINEKPEWQHKCQMCTGCLHYCPQKAIQWGEYTKDRERYNHPYIKVKELMNQKHTL
ncbi:MAG: EFR1 family ferrodoxin [Promethearchaeota archaeon]